MRLKISIIILALLTIAPFGFLRAQSVIVRGKVTDPTDGSALIGVTVVEVDANDRNISGTVTDFNGVYLFKMKDPKNRIRFSYIGYKPQYQNLNNRETVDVQLQPDVIMLDGNGVVVQADKMGSEGMITVLNRATSVSRVEMEEIADVQAVSLDQALQGRMSNVDIVADSGDPGAGINIRIRGASTFTGNNKPLIVIDGIPFDGTIGNDFDFSSADDQQLGALVDIAPEDIETIEVLKDAASAAIWGSRAANGVLVINTKRGTNSKPSLSYSYKLSVASQPKTIPMLSGPDYVRMQKEALFNPSGNTKFIDRFRELAYDPTYALYDEFAQDTDWTDAITQTGYTNAHNVSLRGGGEKARYYLSLGYTDQEGTTVGTALERVTGRFNLDYHLSSKLLLSSRISFLRTDNDRNYNVNQDDNTGDVRGAAFRKMPNMSIYEIGEDGMPTDQYFSPRYYYQNDLAVSYNPVAMAKEAQNQKITDRINTVMTLQYNPKEWLQYKGTVSFNVNSEKTREYLPQSAVSGYWYNGLVNNSIEADKGANVIQTRNEFLLMPQNLGKHQLVARVMAQTTDKLSSSSLGVQSNLPTSDFRDPTLSADIIGANSGYGRYRSMGILYQGNYIYDDRYILSASLRSDASSKFGSEQRWGHFPAVSVAWRMESEKFMESLDFVNLLKIRASYGENGNEPEQSNLQYGVYGTNRGYMDLGGVRPANIELTNLRWETVKQTNIGVDFALWNDRLTVTAEYYNKTTEDLIFKDLSIPSSAGYAKMTQNFGTISNKGFELDLYAKLIEKKDFSLGFAFNIARNRNQMDELPENFNPEKANVNVNGQYAARIDVGDPIGSFYGYVYKGVYARDEDAIARDRNGEPIRTINGDGYVYMKKTTNGADYTFRAGDAIYEDINKDGVINELDVVYLGDGNPDVTGGFGPRIKYKGLALNMFFHYRLGQQVVNQTRMNTENMYTTDNQSEAVLRRWRKPGDETDIPRALYNYGYNWLGSDRFVEDGSYLRLKTLSMSYLFDKKLLKRFGIRECSVTLTAYNLFTWTKYSGQDPEVGLNGRDPFTIGYDKANTPPARSFTLGAMLRF
ncbi:SusC/RagA family TonB-linked outer membrane protein (plasmid) [Fulvitalea axinellae]|uniref:SusC/RagA family TonB-linked outer membrane protein n=1 Tax=Fulvitalea axinellae TaxID=1182444 RepID=A0AAU9DGY3_9BACT|nr:SusC/RagA family TonB-linked outer membrane protein [Fulvitalea axinellae]